jgi:hypothetical protein
LRTALRMYRCKEIGNQNTRSENANDSFFKKKRCLDFGPLPATPPLRPSRFPVTRESFGYQKKKQDLYLLYLQETKEKLRPV